MSYTRAQQDVQHRIYINRPIPGRSRSSSMMANFHVLESDTKALSVPFACLGNWLIFLNKLTLTVRPAWTVTYSRNYLTPLLPMHVNEDRSSSICTGRQSVARLPLPVLALREPPIEGKLWCKKSPNRGAHPDENEATISEWPRAIFFHIAPRQQEATCNAKRQGQTFDSIITLLATRNNDSWNRWGWQKHLSIVAKPDPHWLYVHSLFHPTTLT